MADPNELLRILESPTFATAKNAESARRALEALEAIGDIRPEEARALAQLREAQGETGRAIGQTDALYRGALQGATLNWADEIGLQSREAVDAARAQYPSEFKAGQTGGGILTGVGLGIATAPIGGGGLVSQMAFGGGLGAAEGAAWNAGEAPAGEKMAAAGRGAVVGGIAGAAAPVAVRTAGKAIGAVDDVARGVLNRGNEARANRAIMADLRKAGRTPQDAADEVARAVAQGQPEYRLMDAMGVAGQRRASGITRAGGPGAEELTQFLQQRQLDQGDRVTGFVEDAFGYRGKGSGNTLPLDPRNPVALGPEQVLAGPQKSSADLIARLTEARGGEASRLYDAARAKAGPVDVRAAVKVIDNRIGGMQGSNIKGDSIDAKMAGFRDRLMAKPAPSGELSRELSDFDRVLGVKQDVQDAVGAALRAGRNNEARELGKLVRQLDAALEQGSEAYRFANDRFRDASRIIDAVSEGKGMAKSGRAVDNVARFAGMSDAERRAARVGYGDELLGRIERNTSPTANKAKPLSSTKARREADAMADNPALFRDRIDRENTMWSTQNRALGGSRTADNLQDIEDSGAMADAMRAGGDLALGNTGSAVSRATNYGLQVITGQNAATRKLVADILAAPDPRRALSVALAAERSAQKRQWIAQSVARSLARPATGQESQ